MHSYRNPCTSDTQPVNGLTRMNSIMNHYYQQVEVGPIYDEIRDKTIRAGDYEQPVSQEAELESKLDLDQPRGHEEVVVDLRTPPYQEPTDTGPMQVSLQDKTTSHDKNLTKGQNSSVTHSNEVSTDNELSSTMQELGDPKHAYEYEKSNETPSIEGLNTNHSTGPDVEEISVDPMYDKLKVKEMPNITFKQYPEILSS